MSLHYCFFFSLFTVHLLHTYDEQNGIHPYNPQRDNSALTRLLTQNFEDVVSNSFYDFPYEEEKALVAKAQIEGLLSRSGTTIVMRENGKTVGYLNYEFKDPSKHNPFKSYLDLPGL